MRRHLHFFRRCVAQAFRGSIDRANAWASIGGAALVWLCARLMGISTGLPDNLQGLVGFGLMCLGAAWVVIFILRLIWAPAQIFQETDDRRQELETRLTPRFSLSFEDSEECLVLVPSETGPRRNQNNEIVACRAWWALVRITNDSAEPLRGVQAHLVSVYFKKNRDGTYERQPYRDSMVLMTDGFGPVDLAPFLSRYVNVFAVDEIDRRVRIQWHKELQAHEHLFAKWGFYLIEIQVSTDNGGHKQFKLEYEWLGTFEKPRLRAA